MNILEKGLEELGLTVSEEQVKAFTLFANELRKWNSKINLTSITTLEEITVKHFIDSLAVAKYINPCGNLLDIGSGGGFPSIPLKILYPDLQVISVDAVGKKINFQKHMSRVLGFRDFKAMHSRVEALSPEYDGYFQRIISRAFSDINMFASVSYRLLIENGTIIAMKGRDGRREAGAAEAELVKFNLAIKSIEEYHLPMVKDERSVITLAKM
ncbi:MAG: 16S rRNA (guanine(527)-N(7))-methyltransferase RsmG [Geobacteraceae bacterium]|nr:16S rRNA (guanine(527)-N(7))-methyltransferase RsmG [Geobacteraceae bacterium]